MQHIASLHLVRDAAREAQQSMALSGCCGPLALRCSFGWSPAVRLGVMRAEAGSKLFLGRRTCHLIWQS